jgi:hypothetical protein
MQTFLHNLSFLVNEKLFSKFQEMSLFEDPNTLDTSPKIDLEQHTWNKSDAFFTIQTNFSVIKKVTP